MDFLSWFKRYFDCNDCSIMPNGKLLVQALREFLIIVVVAAAISGGLYAYDQYQQSKDDSVQKMQDAGVIAVGYIADTARTLALRNGCNRNNKGLRRPLYDFLSTARQARLDTARAATDPVEKKINFKAADSYRRYINQMERAAVPNKRADGESPYVNCELAFPLPEKI